MSRKKKTSPKRAVKKEQRSPILEKDLKDSIIIIVLIVIAIFLFLAQFQVAGIVGDKTYLVAHGLLGVGYILLPVTFLFLTIAILRSATKSFSWLSATAAFFFLASGLSLVEVFGQNGGALGRTLAHPLINLFETWMAGIISFGIGTAALLVLFRVSLRKIAEDYQERQEERHLQDIEKIAQAADVDKEVARVEKKMKEQAETSEDYLVAPEVKKTPKKSGILTSAPQKDNDSSLVFLNQFFSRNQEFKAPPLTLLKKDSGKPNVGDIKARANTIKRTLHNFGITVEMDEISIGPSVTRYALKPAEGVKLSRIESLQKDLGLALAAHPLRIEAPIPGKSLVGIEIPNASKSMVGLGSLLSSKEYQSSDKPLLVGLGKGISGRSHFDNLAKMPHLMIAGTTGSGKSVTAHAIITSLLYRNSPDMLKFIMVDPKRVELTLYNGIPHLLTPVITEAKKAILALKWATREMDRRYDVLERHKVRDVGSYHKNIVDPAHKEAADDEEGLPEAMPYIVFIIDELADIMQTYPKELEAGIVRLAQMSRAVGIHLILSTQRPSVNVITGLIKANIPARLALKVSSQIDSRTILDMAGAEKLLGQGDMLFLSGEASQPVRIQSAFISEDEVKDVVENIKKSYEDEAPDGGIDFTAEQETNNAAFGVVGNDDDDDDEMYEPAKQAVIEAGKASTSYIQRKLRVGYARAARLMDILEQRGVVGPADGAKAREILLVDEDGGEEGEDSTEEETND